MMHRLRPHLTYANIVATLALFLVVAGGTAVAATTLINGATLRNRSVSGAKLAPNSITSPLVRNGSLGVADLSLTARRALRGAVGAVGAVGETGAPGSPDTAPQVLSKISTVDGTGSGLDADLVDGKHASEFLGASASAGGALQGAYPNPTLATGSVGAAAIANYSLKAADVGSIKGSFLIDFSSIPATSCAGAGTGLAGVATNDFVIIGGPYSTLGAYSSGGLIAFANASAGASVTITVCNVTSGAIDPPSTTFDVLVFNQ